MSDRDTWHDHLDDWFDEPDTAAALEERPARLERSRQSADQDSTHAATRRPRRTFTVGHAALGAALLVVVGVLGGLAAAGAFSSAHHTAAPPTTTPAPTTRTPTTTQQVTPPAPAVAVPTATLKPGDQGDDVKVLQRALAHLGYSPGTIDGDYGPSTTRAVSSFQQAQGLTADGVLGPETLSALGTALQSG